MITRIEFQVTVDGRTCVATFIRPEKIEDLLTAPGALGEFLRALADNCADCAEPSKPTT